MFDKVKLKVKNLRIDWYGYMDNEIGWRFERVVGESN